MTTNIDIQKLELSPIVELFELNLTNLPGNSEIYYWTPNMNRLNQPVVWAGQQYTPWPVKVSGYARSGKGQIPRPTLTLGNVTRLITSMVVLNDDIIGATFTRRRTLYKYLDAVNFEGGVNPTADPSVQFAPEIYFVDRKASETAESVEFELASPLDVHGVYLPSRQIVQNYCAFTYKDAESGCDYVPGAMFTKDDVSTTNPALDVCSHTLNGCKLRNGSREVGLPFGGFPSVGLLSQ